MCSVSWRVLSLQCSKSFQCIALYRLKDEILHNYDTLRESGLVDTLCAKKEFAWVDEITQICQLVINIRYTIIELSLSVSQPSYSYNNEYM